MTQANQTAVSSIFFYTLFFTRETADKEKLRKFYNEERNRNVCRKGSKAT